MTDSPTPAPAPTPRSRDRLPDVRDSLTHKFTIKGQNGDSDTEVYMIVGFYPDGRIGELFVTLSLDSTALGAMLDQWAAAVSIALQYGAPLESIVRKFTYQNFGPRGWTGSQVPVLRSVNSVVDYIARALWLIHANGAERFTAWKPGDPDLAFLE